MFSEKQLIERIKIIFNKEEKDMRYNDLQPVIRINRHSDSNNLCGSAPIESIGRSPPPRDKINLDVPNTYLVYENFELLNQLYSRISSNKNQKTLFLICVSEHIISDKISLNNFDDMPSSYNACTAGLAFYFLFRIKGLSILQNIMQKRAIEQISLDIIYKIIQMILIYEHYLITEEDIEYFEDIRSNLVHYAVDLDKPMMHNIYDLINDLKVYRLKKELSDDINYEINKDKEKVHKYILDYGFDGNAAEALNKIDNSYYDSSENSFDLRNNISLLKEVFDSVTKSVLEKLKQVTGRNPIKKNQNEHDTEMKHRFICKELSFTEGERKSMSSINKMLNEEKHSLMSKKEKFRITKNFTIEFLLLLFSKLNQLEPTVTKNSK